MQEGGESLDRLAGADTDADATDTEARGRDHERADDLGERAADERVATDGACEREAPATSGERMTAATRGSTTTEPGASRPATTPPLAHGAAPGARPCSPLRMPREARRGLPGQRPRREAECAARRAAVEATCRASAHGARRHELAHALGVSARTLRRWESGRLKPSALGRRAKRGTAAQRDAALALMAQALRRSPAAFAPLFPGLARRELYELRARLEDAATVLDRVPITRTTWTRVGAVWAMDHSDVGVEIDGARRHLLVVRDLASGFVLLALPCGAQDGATVRAALALLFAEHGAPLVIKSDNGGAFVAAEGAALLERHGVLHLRSPAYTPRYNGACEAGIGSIKVTTFHQAMLAGRPAHWTSDDLHAGRDELNELKRAGPRAPTSGELWRGRTPLEPDLRERLAAAFRDRLAAALLEHATEGRTQVCDREVAKLRREALAGALQATGLLCLRRVSIPRRWSPRRAASIGNLEEASCPSR